MRVRIALMKWSELRSNGINRTAFSPLTEGANFEHSDHGPDLHRSRFVEILPEVGPRDHPRHDTEERRVREAVQPLTGTRWEAHP